jgi:hypothetical protein
MTTAKGRQMTIREHAVATEEAGLTADRTEECGMILMTIGGRDRRGHSIGSPVTRISTTGR